MGGILLALIEGAGILLTRFASAQFPNGESPAPVAPARGGVTGSRGRFTCGWGWAAAVVALAPERPAQPSPIFPAVPGFIGAHAHVLLLGNCGSVRGA